MLISPSIQIPTLNLTLTLNDRSDFYSYTIQNIVIFQDFKIICWPLYIGFSQKIFWFLLITAVLWTLNCLQKNTFGLSN